MVVEMKSRHGVLQTPRFRHLFMANRLLYTQYSYLKKLSYLLENVNLIIRLIK
jgi:hypothetical protein